MSQIEKESLAGGVAPPKMSTTSEEKKEPKMSAEEKAALLNSMKDVKDDLAKQMEALTSELAKIQGAMNEIKLGKKGKLGELEKLAAQIEGLEESTTSSDQEGRNKISSGSSSLRNRGHAQKSDAKYSDFLYENEGNTGGVGEYEDYEKFTGEGFEYNTKTARLDLDNPGSKFQQFIFVFYVAVLGFIAYQLHQIFYVDEYSAYESDSLEDGYY